MAIIISKGKSDFQKVEKITVAQEKEIQEYIMNHPELLPVEGIKENARVVVVARELRTAASPIDAFGVDADGEIYIIETKLGKNADKRQVVAQAFDYGAALWQHTPDFGDFLSELNQKVTDAFGVSLEQKIKDEFVLDDEGMDAFKDNMRSTLRDGTFNFIVLMDEMDEGLKDLIVYVNSKSRFNLYGVETEFYNAGEINVVIPRLYGAEVRKESSVSTEPRRLAWTEDKYFEVVGSGALPPETKAAIKKLYDFALRSGFRIFWGRGVQTGSYTLRNNKISIINVYTNGEVGFPVYQYPPGSNLKSDIEAGLNVLLNADWPYFKSEVWAGKVDILVDIFKRYLSTSY